MWIHWTYRCVCVCVCIVYAHMCASVHMRHTTTCIAAVQLLSCVQLFVIPWIAAFQDSPSFTMSPSLLKLMSTESVVPSNHLILCHPPSPPALHLSQHHWSALLTQKDHILEVKVTRPIQLHSVIPLFLCLALYTYQSALSSVHFHPFWASSMCQCPHLGPRWHLAFNKLRSGRYSAMEMSSYDTIYKVQ